MSRIYIVCGWLLGISVLCQGAPARAENPVQLSEGARVEFTSGQVRLIKGDRALAKVPLKGAKKGATATLKLHELTEGAYAIHGRTTHTDGGPLEFVALRSKGSNRLDIIWREQLQGSGDAGERIHPAVRFADLNEDGFPEIITGVIYEPATLCGASAPPLLFRKVYDPKARKFRSVAARRPGISVTADIAGIRDPERSTETFSRALTVPGSVSGSAGDGDNPLFLVPPHNLIDGDPETIWVPGNGSGEGEFATFHLKTDAYGVTGIGIRGATGKTRGPASVIVALDRHAYRLVFPDDSADETIWFALPENHSTRCVSLIVERTRKSKKPGVTGISDISLRTELDEGEGWQRLAKDLSHPDIGEQALMLLRAMGEVVYEPVSKAFSTLNSTGKRRAIRLLSEVAPEKSSDLLAAAAVTGDEATARMAVAGLAKGGRGGVFAVGRYLTSKKDNEYTRAAQILSGLNTDDSFRELLKATGKGSRTRRAMLRTHLSRLVTTGERQALLLEKIDTVRETPSRSGLVDLLKVGAPLSHITDQVVERTLTLYNEASAFEDQYLYLEVLVLSENPLTIDALLAAVADPDRNIRALAIQGLSTHPGQENAMAAIWNALSDEAPQVRMNALSAAGKSKDRSAEADTLQTLALTDPWPQVRVLAVAGAPALPPDTATVILEAAIGDSSPMVRKVALNAAVGLDAPSISHAIRGRLLDEEEKDEVVAIAALAAGARCQTDEKTVDTLFELLKIGAEPLSGTGEKTVAVAAAKALGAMGTERAKKHLKKARTRSNPTTDKAIDEALGGFRKGSCN